LEDHARWRLLKENATWPQSFWKEQNRTRCRGQSTILGTHSATGSCRLCNSIVSYDLSARENRSRSFDSPPPTSTPQTRTCLRGPGLKEVWVPIPTPATKTCRRGPRFGPHERANEVCSLPPSRQKEGAKTGHGAFVPGPAWVHSGRNSTRRVGMLRMTGFVIDMRLKVRTTTLAVP